MDHYLRTHTELVHFQIVFDESDNISLLVKRGEFGSKKPKQISLRIPDNQTAEAFLSKQLQNYLDNGFISYPISSISHGYWAPQPDIGKGYTLKLYNVQLEKLSDVIGEFVASSDHNILSFEHSPDALIVRSKLSEFTLYSDFLSMYDPKTETLTLPLNPYYEPEAVCFLVSLAGHFSYSLTDAEANKCQLVIKSDTLLGLPLLESEQQTLSLNGINIFKPFVIEALF